MNILDSVIGAISPGMAVKREVARAKLELIRAYDGASQGRRFKNWSAPGTDADAEIAAGGQRLRQRARDLVRNNPHAAKAVSVLAGNLVGEGIIPRANTGDPTKDAEINKLFDDWAKKCDPEGLTTFYGKQYLAVREMVEGGEILARRVITKPDDVTDPKNPIVGLQIQLLEPDFIDESKTASKGKATVVNGIQFDGKGARTGYWLLSKHPGSAVQSAKTSTESKLVPSDQVAHLYEQQRTQVRGATWLAPGMRDLRDLDDYEQSELVRKKIESCVVAIVTPGEDDPTDAGITSKVTDAAGNTLEKFEPGIIAYARGGKQIHFNNPSVSMAYEPYVRNMLRKIAAALRIPYEYLTNDLSNVNFSSARVGIMEFRRFVRAMQWHCIIPMFCQPAWDWFILAAKLQGLIDDKLVVNVKWSVPKFEHINPLDDVRADILAVRSGFRSIQSVIAASGEYPETVFEEIEATNLLLDEKGIILDSDPRHTTAQGILQTDATAGDGTTPPATPPKKEAGKPTPGSSSTAKKDKPNGKTK